MKICHPAKRQIWSPTMPRLALRQPLAWGHRLSETQIIPPGRQYQAFQERCKRVSRSGTAGCKKLANLTLALV